MENAYHKNNLIERSGLKTIKLFHYTGEAIRYCGNIAFGCLHFLRYPQEYDAHLFFEESYEFGCKTLPLLIIFSALINFLITLITIYQFKLFSSKAHLASLAFIATVRRLAPFIVALFILGKASTINIASDDTLDQLHGYIEPVIARLVAVFIVAPCLYIWIVLTSIVSGFFLVDYLDISINQYILQIKNTLHFKDLLIGILKTLAGSILVVIISSYYQKIHTIIPEKTVIRTIIASIFWLIVLNLFFELVLIRFYK